MGSIVADSRAPSTPIDHPRFCSRCGSRMSLWERLVDSAPRTTAEAWYAVHRQTFGRVGLVLTTGRAQTALEMGAFELGREVEREAHEPPEPPEPPRPSSVRPLRPV